ncbi:hypothetical protein E4634_06760 [Mangrovimicrobium sediminis]|uniref:Sulfotransferase domain-containing protein n=1 Tax=Mangrovimicrobium sediminis TaxID=2562682 RepID=A0A4Z0M672_9GAMM|nr:sulfotransferase [Haliea sp. SAOS-164]TGD74888.1 hypothetical protein E4634_06760 [Haliea sp. SAOS-164]
MTPLIHIGLPKSLSTWLQLNLFNGESGFKYALHPGDCANLITLPGEFSYSAAAVKQRYFSRVEEYSGQDGEFVPVVSQENLSGSLAGGGCDGERHLHRLKSVFPEGKVLIIIREQGAFIRSAYSTLVMTGFPHSIRRLAFPSEDVEREFNNLRKWGHPGFSYEYLRYDKLVRRYMQAYGRDNVLVLPFEKFASDPEDFVRNIFAFSGYSGDPEPFLEHLNFERKVNQTAGYLSLAIHRNITRFIFTNLYNAGFVNETFRYHRKRIKSIRRLDTWIPDALNQWAEARVERYIRRVTEGEFSKSNAKLASLIDCDLGKYGYR